MILLYFGLDCAGMCLTFAAIYLLGSKSRLGFSVMMSGNTCWVGVGFLTGSIAMVLANVAFFAMNVRGWLEWSQENASQ